MAGQSEQERLQRLREGGSDSTTPSFNNPEYVRFDSIHDSKDLGDWSSLKADLTGVIGAEAGTQTLFFKFRLSDPGPIRLQLTPTSKWTDRFLQLALLDADQRTIPLDANGFARLNDISNTEADEASIIRSPGEYTIVLSCSQWQTTPFSVSLGVNPKAALFCNLYGRGQLGRVGGGGASLRVAVSYLVTTLTGRGGLGGGGSVLFSGRRDRPLGQGPLIGRGRLTGTLTSKVAVSLLAAARLTGTASLGGSRVTTTGGGDRFWISRLTTAVELSTNPRIQIAMFPDGDSIHYFHYTPAGGTNTYYAFVRRNIKGEVLWSRISSETVASGSLPTAYSLFCLPNGETLFFGRTGGYYNNGGNIPKWHIGKLRQDGTLAYYKHFSVSHETFSNTFYIEQLERIVYHPGIDKYLITANTRSAGFDWANGLLFITFDPTNGTFDTVRLLLGLPEQWYFNYLNPGRDESCGLAVQPNGRVYAVGFHTGLIKYNFIVDMDANMTSISRAYQYTDGSTFFFTPYANSILDKDGNIQVLTHGINGWGSGLVTFDQDLQLTKLYTNASIDVIGGGSYSSNLQYEDDGSLHFFNRYNRRYVSLDVDGESAYREMTFSNGLGGGTTESEFYGALYTSQELRWGVMGWGGSNASLGHTTVAGGFEVDMPTSTITAAGVAYSAGLTSSVRAFRRQTAPLPNLLRYGLSPTLFTPTATTVDAAGLTLNSGVGTLSFTLETDGVQRGLTGVYPAPQIDPSPSAEPDPLGSAVVLHLPMSGMRDTNAFTDYSAYQHVMTGFDNAKLSATQARYPDLGANYESVSAYLDGTSDYIAGPTHEAFQFRRNDLTIETLIYITQTSSGCIFDNSPAGSPGARTNSMAWYFNTSRKLLLYMNGAARMTTALDVPLNAWTHIALVRRQGIWRILIGGVPDQTGLRYEQDLTAGGCLIGRYCDTTANMLPAYLQDFRITQAARYTRRFTPRTTPIQYTPLTPPPVITPPVEPAEVGGSIDDIHYGALELFIRGEGTGTSFVDSSSAARSVVPWGNATQVVAAGKWGGAAARFDGDNDYLTVPTGPALGSGNYDVSLWCTMTSSGSGEDAPQVLLDARTAEPSNQFCLRINRTSTGKQLTLYVNGIARIVGSPMVLNTRYHIQVSRVSGVTRLFMNGTQVGNAWTDATNFTATAWTIARGALQVDGNWWHFYGDLNDIRILVGKGLNTSNFTPPVSRYGQGVALPGDLGPVFWYDFADAATVITANGEASTVADKGSRGWALTRSTTGPLYGPGINGLNCSDWGNTTHSNYLRNTNGTSTSLTDIFMVIDGNFGATFPAFNGFVGHVSNSAPSLTGGSGGTGMWADGVANQAFINGSATNVYTSVLPAINSPCIVRFKNSSGTGSVTTSGFQIGMDRSNSNRGFRGLIGEVIVLPSVASDAKAAALVLHLKQKWGIA